mgnify:CR=1 FL=1
MPRKATKPPTPARARPSSGRAARPAPVATAGRRRRPAEASPAVPSKAAAVVAALRAPGGATLPALMALTGWQAHSVRGFLSGTVRKKLGLTVASEPGADGRRYRVTGSGVRAG